MSKKTVIRFGLIEDDLFWQEKIKSSFGDKAGWHCEFTYPSFESFLQAREPFPSIDFLFLDLMLPGIQGVDCIGALRKFFPKKTKIIIASILDDIETLKKALQRGACGYLTKSNFDASFRYQLESVHTKGVLLTPDLTQKLVDKLFMEEPGYYMNNELLSPREWQILHRLSEGDSYEEAAQKLRMSINTFRYYIKKLYTRLGIDTSTSAVAWYYKQRMCTPQ